MSDFILDYESLGKETEIPPLFSTWCAISGISASLGRRCWLDMGTYTIYPNIYVVLVAGSGRCRKSTAIGVIEKMIRALDPPLNLIAQRLTPEGLIDAVRLGDGIIIKPTNEGFVIVDELAMFLNRKSYESGLAPLLIQMYDCKSNIVYRTKGRGTEAMVNTCLGLLGASTVDWIRDAVPEEAVGGGLTSRMIFVYVEEPPPPIARTSYSEDKRRLQLDLTSRLSKMQDLEGEFKLTDQAWTYYDHSYTRFYKHSPMFNDKLLSGYASRRHVHLMKLSMVFAATEGRLLLDENHLRRAEDLLSSSELYMPRVLALITTTGKGTSIERILLKIRGKGESGISRTDLMRSVSHQMDTRGLSDILQTLEHAGQVKQELVGRKLIYRSLV